MCIRDRLRVLQNNLNLLRIELGNAFMPIVQVVLPILNSFVQDVYKRQNCGSTQITANKKGFSLGKAIAGGIILTPIAGVATGMLGKNKIIITCLSCGKQFKPGR